jgi:hypothetical protein
VARARDRPSSGGERGEGEAAAARSSPKQERALPRSPALLTHPRTTHTTLVLDSAFTPKRPRQTTQAPQERENRGGETQISLERREKKREEENAPVLPATRSSCGHDDARLRHGASLVGAALGASRPRARPRKPLARNKPKEEREREASSLRPCRSLSLRRSARAPWQLQHLQPLRARIPAFPGAGRPRAAARTIVVAASLPPPPPPLPAPLPAHARSGPFNPNPNPNPNNHQNPQQQNSNPKSSSCARAPTPPRENPSSSATSTRAAR